MIINELVTKIFAGIGLVTTTGFILFWYYIFIINRGD